MEFAKESTGEQGEALGTTTLYVDEDVVARADADAGCFLHALRRPEELPRKVAPSESTASGSTSMPLPRATIAASSARRATSPWPSGRSTRPTTPTPTRLLVPGSLVFSKTGPGAAGRRPQLVGVRARRVLEEAGRQGTSINGRDRHPVVQVAYEDAEAYASWAGKELPTEAEWEYAARGGLEGARFAWGDEHFPTPGRWRTPGKGSSRGATSKADGYEGTSPVGTFPPNGYGLYDMCGNSGEWTSD